MFDSLTLKYDSLLTLLSRSSLAALQLLVCHSYVALLQRLFHSSSASRPRMTSPGCSDNADLLIQPLLITLTVAHITKL